MLIWGGNASQPSTVLLKRHMTGAAQRHTHEAFAAVSANHNCGIAEEPPRSTLVVSDLTRQPFSSEASFPTWACRAFHSVFGK